MEPDVELKGDRIVNPIIHRSCTLTTAQAMIQKQASCETEYWEPEAGESRKRKRTKRKAEGETYLESNETIGLRTKATKKSS